MDRARRIVAALEPVYRSVAEPEGWDAALRGLAQLFESDACAVATYDFGAARGDYLHAWGYDASALARYPERFAPHNPWLQREPAFRRADVAWLNDELIDGQTLTRTEFFRAWLEPQGLRRHGCGVILREGAWVLYLETLRRAGRGPFTGRHRTLYGMVLPHLRRAWELATMIRDRTGLEPSQAKRMVEIERLPHFRHGSLTGRLRLLYRLTPTEADLATRIAHGLSVQELAGELGVAENTIRTHLQHVYAKTGVRRQAELVSLVLKGVAEREPLSDRVSA